MRDTDADWTAIAEHEPYFGVLANESYLAANMSDEALEGFYESGRGDIAHAVAVIRLRVDASFTPRVAVDFGSGVGRLSLAMAEHVETVIGVDVAPAMRSIATDAAHRRGLSGVSFADTAPESGVDWVNSLIVFQHIPPERGYELLASLLASVVPGGVISIQITTHRDQSHLHEVFRDLALVRFDGTSLTSITRRPDEGVGHMSMFDYDLGRVLAMMAASGFERSWLEHTDHGGVHGFWIFAQRAVEA